MTSFLRAPTDPRWLGVALGDLDSTLQDHAHCEKKAAASALKLVADHPDRPELVRALAKLVREELEHFLAVLVELGRRGLPLPPDRGDPYAQALVAMVRSGDATARLVDRLLVAALIEARSCERLGLLAEALVEPRLRELYARLARSESGHERLFLELARGIAGDAGWTAPEVDARLRALAEEEARIVARLPVLARVH